MPGHKTLRQWYRLHLLTWFTIVVSTAALLELNIDSHHAGGIIVIPAPPVEHGWPQTFLVRATPKAQLPTTYSLSLNRGFANVDSVAGFQLPSRWPFDDTPVSEFSTFALIVNVSIGLAIVFFAAVAVERWTRRRSIRLQCSLRTLFAVVAWGATALALVTQFELEWLTVLSHVSVATVVLSIGLAWFGVFDTIAWYVQIVNAQVGRTHTNVVGFDEADAANR